MVRSLVSHATPVLVAALNEAVYFGLTYACFSLVAAGVARLRQS